MRHRTVLPVFAVLALACSSDSMSTGPSEPEWRVTLSVTSIVVAEMCDGFPVDIDGGEWTHQLTSRFMGESTRIMGGTTSYPNAAHHANIGRGGILHLDPVRRINRYTGPAVEGDQAVMTIRATEWDFDIFGNNPYPDSRMDDRAQSTTFTFKNGAWPNVQNGRLILQEPTESCRVIVNYRFEAVEHVEEEAAVR